MPAISIFPVTGLPEIGEGDDIATMICSAAASESAILANDIVVIAQKIVSKAEGRRIALNDVTPSPAAVRLAELCNKDARLVELVLRESVEIVRCVPGILIARHRLGFVVANAAIDQSNVPGGGDYALLLPVDPDESARKIAEALSNRARGTVSVIINDSFGRPFREGTCGVAIGSANVEALVDLRGAADREGRTLQASLVAHADELAAAASLVMGQAAEGVPAAVIRGVARGRRFLSASSLVRTTDRDLFR